MVISPDYYIYMTIYNESDLLIDLRAQEIARKKFNPAVDLQAYLIEAQRAKEEIQQNRIDQMKDTQDAIDALALKTAIRLGEHIRPGHEVLEVAAIILKALKQARDL
jgi:hypothetical protein